VARWLERREKGVVVADFWLQAGVSARAEEIYRKRKAPASGLRREGGNKGKHKKDNSDEGGYLAHSRSQGDTESGERGQSSILHIARAERYLEWVPVLGIILGRREAIRPPEKEKESTSRGIKKEGAAKSSVNSGNRAKEKEGGRLRSQYL